MSATRVSDAPRAPGRPRDPEIDLVILQATIELLTEQGFGELSIEAVAARANVGKTTIYRRWPSKIPLVVDALAHLKPQDSRTISDDMTTREALVGVLSDLACGHANESGTRILAGLVGEMSKDRELAKAVRAGLVAGRRCQIVDLIERGVARGEIRPDVDTEVMADLLGGPFLVRKLITGKPVTPALAEQIVTLVLDGSALVDGAGQRRRVRH